MTTKLFDKTIGTVMPNLGPKGVRALSAAFRATDETMEADAKVTQGVMNWIEGDYTNKTVLYERMVIALQEDPEFTSPRQILSRVLNVFNRNNDRQAITKIFSAIHGVHPNTIEIEVNETQEL